MARIGHRSLLTVLRETSSGAVLDGESLGEILLPGRYLPRGLRAGTKLDVFLYRDSEDRVVATTETPHAMVGEFACLRVTDMHEQLGAFLDWGLSKDLLLPLSEQGGPLRIGQTVVVAVCVDPRTDRIMASAQLNKHFSLSPPKYAVNQRVDILICGKTPLGFNAIIDQSHRGLLYDNTLTEPLSIGDRMHAYVRLVRPDGKIDLSLDSAGYARVAPLTDEIMEALESEGGKLMLDDDSSPVDIRNRFGVSKKAFKQAIGKLLRERRITFMNPGIQRVNKVNASITPTLAADRPPGVTPANAPDQSPPPATPRANRSR